MARRRYAPPATGAYYGASPTDVQQAEQGVDDQIYYGAVPEDQIYPPGDQGPGPSYDDGPTYAPSAPAYNPLSDPSYQTLLATLNMQEQQARAQYGQRSAMANTNAAVALPRIAEQGVEQRRGINFGAEARGMFRSGGRLRSLALQQRGEQERTADLQRQLANTLAGYQMDLDQQIMQIALKRADAAAQAAQAAA